MHAAESERFEVKDAETGTGRGLFARQTIRKGEFILEYKGKRIPTKAADELSSRYLFELDEQWTVDGPPSRNTAGYINHACVPNAEAQIEAGTDERDHINIYALRDIQPDEEVTIDYGQEYFDEFIKPVGCKCGALRHRT
jgi:SET domain-containing protein